MPHRKGWLENVEVGAAIGIRFLLFVCTVFGRRIAQWVLRFIVPYYVLTHPGARRSSRNYLKRMGLPHGFQNVYSHFMHFAECTLDRLFLLQGKAKGITFQTHGHEHLARLRNEKRGAILLGAHLGSFEAMRLRGDAEDLPIHIVGYFRNAKRINTVLDRLPGANRARMIEVTPDNIEFVFKLREIIERGEMIAILGDRVMGGDKVEVSFLGGRAFFPTGPYVLAALLRCPIYLTFGLYDPPNRYALYCEPFAEQVTLPRGRKRDMLEQYAQTYAACLERYCRLAPYNWFNFHTFWNDTDVS